MHEKQIIKVQIETRISTILERITVRRRSRWMRPLRVAAVFVYRSATMQAEPIFSDRFVYLHTTGTRLLSPQPCFYTVQAGYIPPGPGTANSFYRSDVAVKLEQSFELE